MTKKRVTVDGSTYEKKKGIICLVSGKTRWEHGREQARKGRSVRRFFRAHTKRVCEAFGDSD